MIYLKRITFASAEIEDDFLDILNMTSPTPAKKYNRYS